MLEISALADAIVISLSLNVEAQKRLTIGVELASNSGPRRSWMNQPLDWTVDRA